MDRSILIDIVGGQEFDAGSSRPKVLVVDDVDANLSVMEKLLAELDCEVVCTSSGEQALALLGSHEFAVCLLDVHMPKMNGFDVARLARRLPTARNVVPIVFVTAMNETEDSISQSYESGAVDVLFKPINAHILLSKVQVFLELAVSKQALGREVDAHRQTVRALEAFSYSVSHDLRAPLRPLIGFSQILLEDYGDKLDDEGKGYLTRIAAAGSRMNQLIDDLLRLFRVGQGGIVLEDDVDISSLAESIIRTIRSADPQRPSTAVTVKIEAGLHARADRSLLRVALDNLLRNAWKFSAKNPDAVIEVGRQFETDETVFFVRDNGVGFDIVDDKEDDRERLFRPFVRFHRSDEFEGTGIGLAIVKRVIDRHGGRIWAQARRGEGATFRFTLG